MPRATEVSPPCNALYDVLEMTNAPPPSKAESCPSLQNSLRGSAGNRYFFPSSRALACSKPVLRVSPRALRTFRCISTPKCCGPARKGLVLAQGERALIKRDARSGAPLEAGSDEAQPESSHARSPPNATTSPERSEKVCRKEAHVAGPSRSWSLLSSSLRSSSGRSLP